MYCAVCGNKLTNEALGSYKQCCNNLGYWYKNELYIKYHLWPKGLKAVKPIK